MGANYSRLSASDVRQFVATVVKAGISEEKVLAFLLQRNMTTICEGEVELSDLVHEMVGACKNEIDKATDPIEGLFAGRLFLILEGLPAEALGDPDYWSYLSVRYFWPFIQIRQQRSWRAAEGASSKGEDRDSEAEKLERYFVGKDHYQLPLRMYLRAQAICNDEDFTLAEIPGTDFWRSQILGVKTSAYPSLAKAVVSCQGEQELSIADQRPVGRDVNRMRVNIDFFDYAPEEAMAIIEPIWRISQ